jgi:NAD(P)-dependent dehydrogenase (short-subunit alcohol dehydrogenase family)
MQLLLTGSKSKICTELLKLVAVACLPGRREGQLDCEPITTQHDMSDIDGIDNLTDLVLSCDRIVLAHGCISPKPYKEMTEKEILYSMKVNLLSIVKIIEIALANPQVRIAVVGSESGLKSSRAVVYGLAKAALHKYIEEKKIKYPDQQLVCVAPSLIGDTGMTIRRHDQDKVQEVIANHPKKRALLAKEVSQMIYYLLFTDLGYTSNVVIHMNGGKFARS